MKKYWILFLSLCLLVACSKQPTIIDPTIEESKEPVTIQIFYSSTCHYCEALKKDFVARVETTFGEQMSFEYYDIDEFGSCDLYDQIMGLYDSTKGWMIEGKLVGVPDEYACYDYSTPLVVVGNYYAFLGYDEALLDDYINDIHLALQGMPLQKGDVAIGRYTFKKFKSHIEVFYSNDCASCQALVDFYVPLLEKSTNATITLIDVDDEKNQLIYEDAIRGFKGSLPKSGLIIVDGQLAIGGYESSIKDKMTDIIIRCMQNKLSKDDLISGMWLK